MKRAGKTGSTGDTIIEVLICIMLVSVILTGAYVTTNRSSIGVRDSQEHAEALKLVQGQLEQVRQNGVNGSGAVFNQPVGVGFCITDAAIATGTGCTQNSSGLPGKGDSRYKLAIKRSDCGPGFAVNCHLFTVRATWDSVTGSGQASEQIAYRIYKAVP